ncbi:hypothetical protein MYX76_00910 [Desulfobacterota bacterium AH_259_B03_O07]|nr:hypothetical protein [Desulfobacterota bacterium AH_259_B03_O07]
MQNHFTPLKKELQLTIKPVMTSELEKIAEIEGVTNPIALVLLQIARFINEKKTEYKKRGLITNGQ